MLSTPGQVGDRAAALGKQLGLTVGETTPSYGFGSPAVQGATDGVATRLKDLGGRWSSRDKALVFGSWSALESVLAAILAEQGERP